MTVQQASKEDIDAYRRESVPLYNDQKLKLGLFGLNISNGLTMSDAPTTFRPTWEHTREVAQRAEAMGFELLVPVARWRGFEGRMNFNSECLETLTWAAGIAAETEEIMVCATSHVPTLHPIVAAKAAVTVDQISGGRFGFNLVMGWFSPEMAMFGHDQREHDERYAYGAEWVDVVKRLWTEEEPFDFHGTYFDLEQAQAWPKPVQRPHPVLVNAGNSPAGVEFSARSVDFNFISIDTVENAAKLAADIKDKAHGYGREIGVMTYAYVICRDTEEEAKAAYDAIIEKGDFEGADYLMGILGMESESFGEQIRQFQERMIAGWFGYPLIGTPEQVVAELGRISEAGVEGVIFGFLDYNEELKYFERNVMPLLEQAGLRH